MYRIVRFYQFKGRQTISSGLTLHEAQAHCQDSETNSSTAKGAAAHRRTETHGPWFDGYEREER